MYHGRCNCGECAEERGDISPVDGEYTYVNVIVQMTKNAELNGLDFGDICDIDHDHSLAKACDIAYQCDHCDEVHEDQWDAGQCCPKWECNFCGWEHSSTSWQSAKEAAADCCLSSCDECGNTGNPNWHSDHNCDNGKGDMRRELPWEVRGIKVDARDPDAGTAWKDAWGFNPEEHNVVRASADYYLLEAMKSGLVGTTDGEGHVNSEVANTTLMQIIRADAAEKFDALVAHWDPILQSYTHMAVGGELRHHNAVGGMVMSDDRDAAWTGWKLIFEAVGTDALVDAAELFNEFGDGSFGGELWADASLILHKRLTGMFNPALFLDRVFNAQHNGGALLNKVQWEGDRERYKSQMGGAIVDHKNVMGVEDMQNYVLPAHGEEPEPDYPVLLAYASSEVRALFVESHEVARRARLELGLTLVGVPARPHAGKTRHMKMKAQNDVYEAKQQAFAALPKSAKLLTKIEEAKLQAQLYQTYANTEKVHNDRLLDKTPGTVCGCGCGMPSNIGVSAYYQDLSTHYQGKLDALEADYKQALLDEIVPVKPEKLAYCTSPSCTVSWCGGKK